jgi:hypothetical protein
MGEPYAGCTGQPLTATVALVFNDGLGDPRLGSTPILVETFHPTVG